MNNKQLHKLVLVAIAISIIAVGVSESGDSTIVLNQTISPSCVELVSQNGIYWHMNATDAGILTSSGRC